MKEIRIMTLWLIFVLAFYFSGTKIFVIWLRSVISENKNIKLYQLFLPKIHLPEGNSHDHLHFPSSLDVTQSPSSMLVISSISISGCASIHVKRFDWKINSIVKSWNTDGSPSWLSKDKFTPPRISAKRLKYATIHLPSKQQNVEENTKCPNISWTPSIFRRTFYENLRRNICRTAVPITQTIITDVFTYMHIKDITKSKTTPAIDIFKHCTF